MINQLTGEEVSDAGLRELSELCVCQLDLEKRIRKYETQLALLNQELTKVSTQLIPDKMADLGISEVKLASGQSVTVKPFYAGGFIEGRQQECIEWLEEHGHGGIVKRSIIREFARGEEAKFKKLVDQLLAKHIPFVRKEGVHPQTFKAFLRELTEKGQSLPEDKFKVFIGKTTKISE